jgi:8-oxo-dGTP pyrophosphatase MutT (NUDIX family)
MQLRDDRPDVHLGGHWGLFGGSVEPGESFAEALLRELREELAFVPRRYAWFTEIAFSYPDANVPPGHKAVFEIPLEAGDLGRMVQTEGAGRRLFDWGGLAAEPRVVPWDACAVMMHARRTSLRRR